MKKNNKNIKLLTAHAQPIPLLCIYALASVHPFYDDVYLLRLGNSYFQTATMKAVAFVLFVVIFAALSVSILRGGQAVSRSVTSTIIFYRKRCCFCLKVGQLFCSNNCILVLFCNCSYLFKILASFSRF